MALTYTPTDLLRERLHNQRLGTSKLRTVADVVAWFGAVQAQDYAGARWAVGQRMTRATDAGVERAFDAGEILRTHVLRPTWHFVAPADIRWMLALSAPRVHGFNAPYYRRNELDQPTLSKARRVLERALGGGTFRTRTELAAALARAGIAAAGERLAYVMMHAELDAVICSGPRRGKQFTYALVDERARRATAQSRDEALAELTRRYFQSHGPATERDFAWWSGLTRREVRRGVEMLGDFAVRELVADCHYCRVRGSRRPSAIAPALLLPNYDESLVAYQDRALSVPVRAARRYGTRGRDTYIHHLFIDGRLAGSWRPRLTGGSAVVDIATYETPTARERCAIDDATAQYKTFVSIS